MSSRGALVVSLVGPLVLAACGAEPAVPDKPTWVDDIRPIYQGNCFHCHGANAMPTLDQFRWDVPNYFNDPKYAELGFGPTLMSSANDYAENVKIATYVIAPPISRMPPPPALPLSGRDIATINKWLTTATPSADGKTKVLLVGEHHPNHKPRIAWVKKPLFEVIDDDQDQVLGQLTCPGLDMPMQLPRAGGFTLPDGAMLPCTARLYDGFDEGGGELK